MLVKEKAITFSFIFLYRLLKVYKQVSIVVFPGTYSKLHGMLRFVCYYVTMHFPVCCDANAIVLRYNIRQDEKLSLFR